MKASLAVALGAGVAAPMLGQTKIIRDELADFFAGRSDRRAERVAS